MQVRGGYQVGIFFSNCCIHAEGQSGRNKMDHSARRRTQPDQTRPNKATLQRRISDLNKNGIDPLVVNSQRGRRNFNGHRKGRIPAPGLFSTELISTGLASAGLVANEITLPSHTSEPELEMVDFKRADFERTEDGTTPCQAVQQQFMTKKDSRQLQDLIFERIQTRIPGRVRNLAVRITNNSVELTGECRTYYTKQMAQHVAMGVLDYQQLVNHISVYPVC